MPKDSRGILYFFGGAESAEVLLRSLELRRIHRSHLKAKVDRLYLRHSRAYTRGLLRRRIKMIKTSVLGKKIATRKATICVIGLGYVGLPLALAFCKKGFFVYGLDTNASRITNLKKGKQYISDVSAAEALKALRQGRFVPTQDERVLGACDVIIICVPTPLRKVKVPDISYIVNASKTIARYIRNFPLIILESTSFPTTTREVVLPLLEKKGLKAEKDFYLCFSPERVNPGDRNHPLATIPKLVGGLSREATLLAQQLYGIVFKQVYTTSSPEVAECAKLLENTFRLVNIALVNEFAIVAHKLGISIWEVIKAAGTKPFGFMPFYPGPGVGGHCIPDDPMYLSWKAKEMGFKTKMIDCAAFINRFMPRYVMQRLKKILAEQGLKLKDASILIIGVTYKKDVKDLRESPALDIMKYLKASGAEVDYHDPLIPYLRLRRLSLRRVAFSAGQIRKYHCLLIATDHSGVDYRLIRKNARFIFDTRNVYTKDYPNVIRL